MANQGREIFEVFREIGILHQLAGALLTKRLPEGLHVSHFGLLSNLVNLGDGKTPAALSSAFQVPKGTMAHTIAVLEKRGLIRVAPNPEDGRSKQVYLTDAGRALHAASIAAMAGPIGALEGKIDMAAVASMLPQLQALRKVMDENRDV